MTELWIVEGKLQRLR